jgi:hypothetical protein
MWFLKVKGGLIKTCCDWRWQGGLRVWSTCNYLETLELCGNGWGIKSASDEFYYQWLLDMFYVHPSLLFVCMNGNFMQRAGGCGMTVRVGVPSLVRGGSDECFRETTVSSKHCGCCGGDGKAGWCLGLCGDDDAAEDTSFLTAIDEYGNETKKRN